MAGLSLSQFSGRLTLGQMEAERQSGEVEAVVISTPRAAASQDSCGPCPCLPRVLAGCLRVELGGEVGGEFELKSAQVVGK